MATIWKKCTMLLI